MNTIIPLIMFIAVILIVYKMYKEKANEQKRKLEYEQKIRRQIESAVLKTVREKADYWDNFNIALYVEYLEETQL